MAKVSFETVTKTVMKPIEESTKVITLTISVEEGFYLKSLLGGIGSKGLEGKDKEVHDNLTSGLFWDLREHVGDTRFHKMFKVSGQGSICRENG